MRTRVEVCERESEATDVGTSRESKSSKFETSRAGKSATGVLYCTYFGVFLEEKRGGLGLDDYFYQHGFPYSHRATVLTSTSTV